jgi:site-specific recombinase XerD
VYKVYLDATRSMTEDTNVLEDQSGELPREFARYLNESGFALATIKNYLSDIRNFASWLARTRRQSLLESTGEDIRDYLLELVTAKAHPPATVNRRLQSIRKFYRYALESGLAEENPSAGVKLLPQPRTQVVRGLNRLEITRFLDAVRQGSPRLMTRDYAIVQLMLQTGIRVGELTRLKLSDVSLSEEKGFLKIRGERASRDRETPLNSSVRKAISAYLQQRPPSRSDHLFLSRKGDPLSVRSVQTLVSGHARAAGLEKVSTYTLRHTHGQHLLRDTGDLNLVARLLGHKRLETAIKYILPRQEDLTEVAERSSLNIY